MNASAYCLLIALLITFVPNPAEAEAPLPEVFFILDGSGSMWGEMGDQTKIEVAKNVLETAVADLPGDIRLGFAAYGHRREKDCTDVEILLQPGSGDREALVEMARALVPRGMTPIARSCREVGELLRGRESETTVVLVSDGVETCDENPCEVVSEMRAEGIRFVMHVVGFGLEEGEEAQLECIAKAGGGRYFSATDSDLLLAAMQDVGAEVAVKLEKAKTVTVKKSTGLGKLHLTFPENGLAGLAGIRIVRPSDGKQIKEAELKGADTTHPLLAGEYELLLLFANSNMRPPTAVSLGGFEIAGGETTGVALGVVTFNVADNLVDQNIDAVSLVNSDSRDTLVTIRENGNDYYLFKPKVAPAGEYDFVIHYYRSPSPTVIASGISVATGAEAFVTLDAGIRLEQFDAGVTGWDLVPAGGGGEPLLVVRRGWDNDEPLWRRFIVPAGTYDLLVRLKGMDEPLPAGEAIEIHRGETVHFDSGF